MDDLEETVDRLQRRVAHLESELGTNYMDEQFQRRVNSMTPSDDADVEIRDGFYGHNAKITNIDGDGVQYIIERVEKQDNIDYAVTETGDGLGVEVWTDAYLETDRIA